MRFSLKAFLAVLAMALVAPAFAADAAAPAAASAANSHVGEKTADVQTSLNPWTDCGIGAMLFTKVKWAAVISNVIWDYGLTATTSAGVSRQTCDGRVVAVAHFINESVANLEEETAAGGGDHVYALLEVRGCDAAARADIAGSLRAGMSATVQDASYAGKTGTEKAQAYYQLLETTVQKQYAGQCGA